jgi:hypothetical protein
MARATCTSSEAKPKSKAISEQTQPLDINQICKDNPGPSVNDFYEEQGNEVT